MIHPTRTNLLLLKEKAGSVVSSIGILKARRQALIHEFLSTTRPFIRSRETVRKMYGAAVDELSLSLGREGKSSIDSMACVTLNEVGVEVVDRSIWGLRYRDILVSGSPVREPGGRGYDLLSTTPHIEECIYLFEKILGSMIEIAAFENKLKRLADEILKIMRKIRVLEEKVLPELKHQVRAISQYISEREREDHFRLKKFKGTGQLG